MPGWQEPWQLAECDHISVNHCQSTCAKPHVMYQHCGFLALWLVMKPKKKTIGSANRHAKSELEVVPAKYKCLVSIAHHCA